MSDIETTQVWALLELMGHRQVVGFVTRSSDPLVRVDVPEVDGKPAFTQEYGKASICCISWIGESEAMAMLQRYKPDPPVAYMLPTALPSANLAPDLVTDEEDDTDDDDAPDDDGMEAPVRRHDGVPADRVQVGQGQTQAIAARVL